MTAVYTLHLHSGLMTLTMTEQDINITSTVNVYSLHPAIIRICRFISLFVVHTFMSVMLIGSLCRVAKKQWCVIRE